jgi:hypothetical protein
MSNPQEHEMTHPLEQVTGEKDVPPEEEEGRRPQSGADTPGTGDGNDSDTGDTTTGQGGS